MDLGLTAKRVILTGGTRGIGYATLQAFLAEGATVAFCARNQPDIDRILAEDSKTAPGRIFGYQADVSDKKSYLSFLEKALGDLNGVDIFIANASAAALSGDDGFYQALEVDLLGAARAADKLLPVMAQQKSGTLVFVSSIMAFEAMGSPGPYASMKAALLSYAGQLVEMTGSYGIRVNCVSPGPIYIEDGFWGRIKKTEAETYQQVAHRHPQGRLGTAKEVADTIVFLSSERACWISGTNVIIDGGFTKSIQF